MRVMPADLIERARAGDGEAFRELTEPHRRELQVHCYRMLGSLQDAEDALQDTMLAAWQGLDGFEGRASLRTWLYRIATNRCLNARRSASRRQAKEWDIPSVQPPEPTRLGEVTWLEPFPDALLAGALDGPLGPEARYEQTESISLAFVTALQVLPPRQVAVLILRDVLGFPASEVADMLDSSVDSVNSALKRARASMQGRQPPTARPPAAARRGHPGRGRDRGEVRQRVRSRGRGRAGRPAYRRRLRVDAADAVRVRRPGPGGAVFRASCSAPAASTTWCRPGRTASPRSVRTCGPAPAPGMERGSSCWVSAATGSRR